MPDPVDPPNGRLQIVDDPTGTGARVLRLVLAPGDYFSDGASNTIRTEFSSTQEDGHPWTSYREGDDRYFALSIYFTPSFNAYSCTSAGQCSSNGNPWNVLTQWHGENANGQNGGSYGITLRRLAGTSRYRLYFGSVLDQEIWNDSSNPDGTGGLWTGHWHDFIIHIRFSTSASTGVIEIWRGIDGGAKVKQSFNPTYCGGDSSVCHVPTLDPSWPADPFHMKQGHYRDQGINDTTTVYFKGTMSGDTYADVAGSGGGGGGACTQSYPAVATLSDSFGGTSIDTSKWTVTSQTFGTVSESGGFLHMAPNANVAGSQLTLQSNGTYALTGSSAFVKAAQVVSSGGGVDTNFTLLKDGSNLVSWMFENGNLYARKVAGGAATNVATLTYSPTSHAWWRVRETGGSVYWETSADGNAWNVAASALTSDVPFVCGVKPTFYTETWGAGSPAPGEARYASFNGTGGPPPPSCSPNACMSSFKDSFGGTSVDPNVWTVTTSGGTVTEGGGSLNLIPNANNGAVGLLVVSKAAYTLTGSSAKVRVPEVVTSSGYVNNSFAMRLDGNNQVQFWYEWGVLYARKVVGGVASVVTSATYSATAHQYWRFRESGGTLYWETSADGTTWATFTSAATSSLFSMSAITVKFYSESWGAGSPAPGQGRYSNLNLP